MAWAGSLETCYRVNLWSRIASRVLCEIGRTPYRSAEDLYRSALEMPWGEWFDAAQTIRVDVTASRSPLESVDFALLRIKDAVCDQFRARCGQRPSVDTRNPEVRIWTFVDEQHATFYLDTSSEPLFKRGYRRARQEAPLKENLAAGLIALTHWDSTREAFLDPMCGSGTIAVEAALIATRTAPGLFRGFGFEKLRGFKPTLWAELRRAAQEVRQPAAGVPIVAADIRPALIEELRASLGPLGLAEVVSTRAGPVESASAPAECGVWLTNPPYGVRMGEAEALALMYRQIGQRLKAGFAGWRCYFFSADRKIPGLLGLREARRTVLYNGALECRLFEFPIVSGRLKG